MQQRRPVLVTGSHRSGSTWVGRIIGASPEMGYIHEPFGLRRRPGICAAHFKYWFYYLCAENGGPYIPPLRDTLAFRYRLDQDLLAVRGPRDIVNLLRYSPRDMADFRRYRAEGRRALLKDPLAIFSADWLARTFCMDVVVIIRHPAAFVGSLKHADWPHPFAHFLRQPLLMRDHLAPFADEIRLFAERPQPLIDQAILLWRLIHYQIARYRATHPGWIFVRHEDISRDPIRQYAAIFSRLGLEFTPLIEDAITNLSDSESPSRQYRGHRLQRDSRSNISSWKKRLSGEEICRVRAATEEIAGLFYGDADW